MKNVDKVIVHCTATPEGRHTTVEDVRRWHLDRGIQGAHCRGQNENSIGIAYVGGINKVNFKPKDTRTEEQKEALVDMLEFFKIAHPEAVIYGHRDFASKACPSFDAKKEYDNITNMWK
jgi:N-acetylmuramoyl-L-alanine amidase